MYRWSGLEKTYQWIYDRYLARERGEPRVVEESIVVQ